MAYKKPGTREYKQTRKKGLKSKALSLSKYTSPTQTQFITQSREFRANLMDLSLFLAKFLSGKNNVAITPGYPGFAVSRERQFGRTYYDVKVPSWQEYDLPLDDDDKFRIYRSGIWHESMHTKYTPKEVFQYGASVHGRQPKVTDPLKHDMINIIEDRRIEDLGCKLWSGYVQERLFSNGYAWSQRMDVGEFWNTYLKQLFDEKKGKYTSNDDYVKTRRAHMRHEAFLQRLIVGKVKGVRELPMEEREKIEKAAEHIEEKLKDLEDDPTDASRVSRNLKRLTNKVIRDLQLEHWKPPVTRLGESSWDETFKEDYSDKSKQETRAGIDDYFDELMTVEYICTKCGKHYTKRFGIRKGEKGWERYVPGLEAQKEALKELEKEHMEKEHGGEH